MHLKGVKVSCLLVALALAAAGTGCTYCTDRGHDAMDVFDFGVTVSRHAGFALYANVLNLLTLGYSNVDGTLHGIADRQTGALPARMNAYGLLVYGQEQLGYGEQVRQAADWPEPYKVGLVGIPVGPAPRYPNYVNCPKLLHLGWVGLTLTCNLGELADLLLGLTTLDIMKDDTKARLARESAEPPLEAAPLAPAAGQR